MEVLVIASKTKLTGRVISRGDPGYEKARLNWNPFTDTYPLVIVFAQKHDDVVNAIKWARENNVPLRARGGRHALERDMSVVRDGIIIDVSDMTRVRLNSKKEIALIETGIDVGPLVSTLAKYGLMSPFGDSPTVGIAGLTLGGGIGPLQRTIGLASDNLIGVKMVDAEGRTIIADENNNSDLLWASRGGGGGNFGIATEYKYKVHRAPEKATVFDINWPWEQIEDVVKVWQRWSPSVDDRLGTSLSINTKTNGLLQATGLFLGSKAELTYLLEPLLTTGTPSEVNIQTLAWPAVVENRLQPDQIPTDMANKFSSSFGFQPFPDEAIKAMRYFLENATGTDSNFFFLNWGGEVSRVSPEATAFFWRDPKFYFEWSATWKNPSDAQRNIALVERTREMLKPFSKGSYVNVPDFNIKNFGSAYYGTNFDRLREVKTKYDPKNVFHYPQSIPPFYERSDF
ncbi:FAD-binding oxidoreductase [Terribacillus saccharophilus]|uniref:FAD-binding protein n=1 Tax=Terribacillus saccharophilus TaxID=361277 RepID=A0A268ABI2_9BACI|nr:FAD-binding oxidoreductase [Terribacillus saccharophilus]PAD21486.1 FAD-binding protein [Terribacillus saccharophilus]